MSKIGLLLPAHNEERNIAVILKEAKKHLPDAKILVVDDGSKDRTFEIASKMKVNVKRHEKNMGKGTALKTGFKYFIENPVDFVIVSDTDRQYKIGESKKILDALETKKGDFVTGYRNPKDIPYANRMGNFIWRTIFNMFFHTKFKDTNCGFIGLNKKALRSIRNFEAGYSIENSMFINCVRNGLKVYQVPVRVYYGKRRVSKFAKMFFSVLIFILRKGFRHRNGR
jgi:glycosyltransferase involved in cell wall biosynthesis